MDEAATNAMTKGRRRGHSPRMRSLGQTKNSFAFGVILRIGLPISRFYRNYYSAASSPTARMRDKIPLSVAAVSANYPRIARKEVRILQRVTNAAIEA
ncbi:hypothetical protein U1Q18_044399 [Sarracenia purpurea var. burkii]